MSKTKAGKRAHLKRQAAWRRRQRMLSASEGAPRLSKRRRIVTLIVALMILATLVMIFLLSAENKADSGDRSGRVTGLIVDILFGRRLTASERTEKITQLGHAVRKLAHMTEYALLTAEAAALMILLRPVRPGPKKWPEWVIPFAACVVYAASDELHQVFSHRGASVTDVLIDCAGGLIGLCLMHAATAMIKRIRRRRANKSKEKRHANQLSPTARS